MAKAVAETPKNTLPAHLLGGKKESIGNIDRSDLIIPRIKLLQSTSPEVQDGVEGAKMGEFWHTIGAINLGKTLRAVPLIVKKSYVLWAPRGDDRGILARADDKDGTFYWDQPAGMVFEVKPKKAVGNVKYTLGRTVNERINGAPALAEFGSSIPGNDKSPPAASLTYTLLWFFLDFPEMSPSIIINTRSSIRPAKVLLSKIDNKPIDHYGQVYQIGVVKEKGEEGDYFNYVYTSDGYVEDEADFKRFGEMYRHYKAAEWKPSEESEEDTDRDNLDSKPKVERSAGKVDDEVPF